MRKKGPDKKRAHEKVGQWITEVLVTILLSQGGDGRTRRCFHKRGPWPPFLKGYGQPKRSPKKGVESITPEMSRHHLHHLIRL